jgi:xanthine dehydrogenase accessory factor
MINPFVDMDELLENGRKLVMARIIRQVGSAPRSIGSKCLVLDDGSLRGTIGGGFLEYQVMEKAAEVLKRGKTSILHFQLTGEEVAKTEMLCGGIVDVYLEPIFPEDMAARAVFQKAKALVLGGRRGTLVTTVSAEVDHGDEACRSLVAEDGSSVGAIGRIPGCEGPIERWLGIRKPRLVEQDNHGPVLFVEPVEPDHILYLFGAGHISTFVAPLAKMVGFRVVVIDDREEFASTARFPNIDDLLVAPFLEAFHRISTTPTSYIAIITRGHIHDREVLRAALKRAPAYIGMVGSRRKRDLIYESLLEEGVPAERIEQVHAPIGLEIGAETPEEIAISIVGELIKVRAEEQRREAQ